ncbi:HD domain-containing protein [Coniochaeta hoffmannii]|uniref:5'-deoxynucleotidase n=1 Tax=Coniochaeta hoffmannii TaxID=91930 RepID=A0AA38VNR6_9PEZI|nr:HD domain-containing protein [Coniochaeta hoffmannii]
MSPAAVPSGSPGTENRLTDVGLVHTPKVADPWTVEKVLDTIRTGRPAEGSSSPVPYFHILERLKTTKREGWRRFGIDRGESIADHMYRMSLMSMLAPPSLASRLDLHKCMKMCLIHDMAESLVGDITPVDGVAKPEKSRREATTMDYITKTLLGNIYGGQSTAGEDIRAIWQEYEDSKTLESLYVHDIDKVELLLQMVEYERRGREQGRGEADKLDLGEFAYVATKLVLPETKEWAAKVLEEREELWERQPHVHGEDGIKGGVRTETAQAQDTYYEK